jgi:hypothetical protein
VNVGPVVAIGVGSGETGRVADARGDTSAPVCNALFGGDSGLQPTTKSNARNNNVTTYAACFEEIAMRHLLIMARATLQGARHTVENQQLDDTPFPPIGSIG